MRTVLATAFFLIPVVPVVSTDVPPEKVDELFVAYNSGQSPGCSVGVIHDGNFIFRKSYGEANLELGVPLTSQSVFYMASVSKQFTAASIVLAAQQGFLSLDDSVRKYVPEIADYGNSITLRQMLHQTSGLRDYLALTYLSGRDIAALSSPTGVAAGELFSPRLQRAALACPTDVAEQKDPILPSVRCFRCHLAGSGGRS